MTVAENAPTSFNRTLGLLQVTASGVSIIVGAGIFVLLGPATEQAGSLVWLGFVVSAVLCALTAFSYMELASMFPRAGSEFEFARQVFPPRIAFAVGWSMAAALVVAAAAVAVGFARYAAHFVDVDRRVIAVLTVAVSAAVSSRGMRIASRLIVVLAGVQIAGLLAVVGIGIPYVGEVNLLEGRGVGGVLSAAALVFFAYIGFDEVVTLSEETRNPQRTIPLALFLSLTISAVVYVMVAVVAVSVLGPELLVASERPLADVAARAVGGRAVGAIATLSLVSTFTTVILAVSAGARMVYSLAGSGFLPPVLATVAKGRTPGPALALISISSAVLAATGGLSLLASATDALVFLMFIVTNIVLVVLRVRRPEVERPFRVRGNIAGLPMMPLAGILVTVVLMVRLKVDALALAGGLVLLGYVAGAWFSRSGGTMPSPRVHK